MTKVITARIGHRPHGIIRLDVPAPTALTTTPTEVLGTFTTRQLNGFEIDGNRLRYIDARPTTFAMIDIGSLKLSANNRDIELQIAKAGVEDLESEQGRWISTASDLGNMSVGDGLDLLEGDEISLFASVSTGTANLNPQALFFIVWSVD